MDHITSVRVRKEGSHFLTRYMVNTQWRYCYKRTIKQCFGISHDSKGPQPSPLVVCIVSHYPCCSICVVSQPAALKSVSASSCPLPSDIQRREESPQPVSKAHLPPGTTQILWWRQKLVLSFLVATNPKQLFPQNSK